jgi:E3 ubiquitin-protein ligase UBR4
MVDDKGCCSVCARVCHKNHDVCYAKFGNFYCDCGAKEDGSCQAMSLLDNSSHPTAMDHGEILVSSLKRQTSSTISQPSNDFINNLINNKQVLAKVIDGSREQLSNQEMWRNVIKCLLNFCTNLMPIVKENCAKFSTVGCHSRAKSALDRLHQPEKAFSYSEQVMIATLGSQEGAFENVRMNYSGDQGQTIRQLLSSNLIRRVALCCLASPQGKRQHLAVSHEKGKVTILQLSALLKQADAAKKKLTLTRLSSVPITCMVLSLAANPANEDFLAVCGLRECHVLTFTANGTVSDHIVLTLQLDNGNYLRRAIWLPGSQTKLALVTAEYVKIYDLAEDSLSPLYNFVVPSGDIRDVCFVHQENDYFMLIMSSLGYIYTQPLTDESLATHGAFYVTNTLDLDHSYIRDVNGQILGGGVSLYYSHTLQLLFFSYAMGKSFMAPLTDVNEGVKCVINLLHSSKVFSKGSANGTQSPLCQWMEIQGHPGLVCAMMQNSNNPVIFMLKPDGYLVQEIKAQNSKAKIMDMVAIRHQVSGSEKTTLILLCEDGSLRIYAANNETTSYWMSPEVQPIGNYYNSGVTNKDKKKKTKKSKQQIPKPPIASSTTFPVDFFEHCSGMNDVEYGGNDLLEIYNVQQLQHRLNSTGLYVASTRFNGFTLETVNKDANMVITGIRFLIGTQDVSRAPTAVTVLGRKVPTICTRARWFAIPLTREESLQADKKLNIHFSPSQDPEFVTMLDSIKIYGKTKEAFGWPDEIFDDTVVGTTSQIVVQPEPENPFAITALDKMITSMLDVIDNGFYLLGGAAVDANLKQQAIDVTTSLILLPTPGIVQQLSRSVLATLHPTKTTYHAYKDREVLNDINKELQVMLTATNFKSIDPEGFYRLVLTVRNISIQRPQQLTKICQENNYPIVTSLMCLVKELHKISTSYDDSIVHYGLTHKEATIQSLIEIFYAFIFTDPTLIESMVKFMVELLLDKDPQVSHSAKYAIIRLLRPKVKRPRKVLIESTTPPSCQTPTPTVADDSTSQDVDLIEPLGLVPNDPVEPSLEALLGMAGGPARDVHGEALMEFALELYLQEYDGDIQGFQGLANRLRGNQAFQAVAAAAGIDLGVAPNQPRVNNSAGGSDDDDEAVSNAATDGSRDVNQILTTSPSAEQLNDGGSGNGSDGSGAESTGGASGRSSTYEDSNQPKTPTSGKLESVKDEEDCAVDQDSSKLHQLRIVILESLVDNFSALDDVNGRQVIPFMQVILMLTTDLDGSQEVEKNIMAKLLTACVDRLEMNPPTQATQLAKRSAKSEVQLIILRFVGILMGKIKTLSSKSGASVASAATIDNIQFVASATAAHLMRNGAIVYCLTLLESFLPYWKQNSSTAESNSASSNGAIITTSGGTLSNSLLKPTVYGPVPDMQPFFARQYIKGLADIFELYPQVLTEMAVRLPYQILKLSNSSSAQQQQHSYDSAHMTFTLCEYMMHMNSPVLRRQVRKLLLYMCGNKERYRKLRDLHSLNEHMKSIRVSSASPTLTYQALVSLMDHLKACYEIAAARTGNWQRFCLLNTDILSSLLSLSCHQFDHEQISTIILQLLQAAVVSITPAIQEPSTTGTQVKTSSKDRKDRDKSEEMDEAKFDPANCNLLVQQIFNQVPIVNLTLFIKTFLLETNAINIRWLAHGLIYAFYDNSNEANKSKLLQVLWGLWPMLPAYGKRAPQFVDLIGFFTLNTKSAVHKLPEKIAKAVKVLREQNELVAKHPSASLYTSLGQVLELDGFYLESEPCLVCNNVDQSMSIIKLTSIKMDSKFTTNSNIIKLVNSHIISKIILRIGDLKRTKMVRTINIFYNSRNVQAVVELKNRPSMWHKAKSVTLQSGQTDVSLYNFLIDFEQF